MSDAQRSEVLAIIFCSLAMALFTDDIGYKFNACLFGLIAGYGLAGLAASRYV